MSKLSLCMIVKNEEETLPVCLESVRHVVDEMVVVDTGSTDSTRNVAERFGAKVIGCKWRNDFSQARNLSLENASGDWILVLDADEELIKESCEEIRRIIETSDADAFEITVRSEMPETDMVRFDEIKLLRLFRNKKEFRYSLPIHEQVRPAIVSSGGRIAGSSLVILHHGYAKTVVQGKDSRGERNLKILREAAAKYPDDPYLSYQIGATLMSSGNRSDAYSALERVLGMDYSKMPGSIIDKLFMKLSQLAVERNDNQSAVEFAQKSLQCNPSNTISKYVLAIAYLSLNRVMDGYRILLKIKEEHDPNINLGNQLDHLILACRSVLGL